MAHLIPCTECARHVQSTDSLCPFCGAALPIVGPLPLPPPGVSRGAALAFGAAALVVACVGGSGQSGDAGTDSNDGDPTQTSSGSSAYGGPPIDPDSSSGDSASKDDGGMQADAARDTDAGDAGDVDGGDGG